MSGEPLTDLVAPRRVLETELVRAGKVGDLHTETVDLGEGGVVRRDVLRHPGASAVVALDEDERVLMIRQYRHATGCELWELPAGLLDVPGEHPLDAARRELAEEADLKADRWDLLVDFYATPGSSDETVRLFLARDVHAVPEHELHRRTAEELNMPMRWVPLDEAVAAVLAGRVHNATAVVGVLAAGRSRELGWSTLRPAEAPVTQRLPG